MNTKTTLKVLSFGLSVVSTLIGLACNWVGDRQQDAKIEEAVAEAVSKALKGES